MYPPTPLGVNKVCDLVLNPSFGFPYPGVQNLGFRPLLTPSPLPNAVNDARIYKRNAFITLDSILGHFVFN